MSAGKNAKLICGMLQITEREKSAMTFWCLCYSLWMLIQFIRPLFRKCNSLFAYLLLYAFICFYHAAYTIAKYGMSMCVLGMAEEFKKEGVAVNALWPKTGNY